MKLNISRQETCEACHGTGSSGINVAVCPECDGTGTVTQMAGAMKFNLTCNRCGGTGRLKNVCPTCRGGGTHLRIPIPWKCAYRRASHPVRVCEWRAKERGRGGWSRGRSVHHDQS